MNKYHNIKFFQKNIFGNNFNSYRSPTMIFEIVSSLSKYHPAFCTTIIIPIVLSMANCYISFMWFLRFKFWEFFQVQSTPNQLKLLFGSILDEKSVMYSLFVAGHLMKWRGRFTRRFNSLSHIDIVSTFLYILNLLEQSHVIYLKND